MVVLSNVPRIIIIPQHLDRPLSNDHYGEDIVSLNQSDRIMEMRCSFSLWALLLLLLPTLLVAQAPECSITVAALNGTATGKKGGLSVGSSLSKGDTIRVGSGSLLELNIGDGGVVKVGANSKIYVDASYCPDDTTEAIRIKLSAGSLWAKGSPALPKFHITSEHFLAMVGNSTIALNARYMDTTFTLSRGSQRIETRDWADTVEVESYSFPFVGETSTIYALNGEPLLVPWGEKGLVLKSNQQATFGFDQNHIPDDPKALNKNELHFTSEGNYVAGS